MAKFNLILEETKSAIDNSDIVVIATGIARKSTNDKTGPMMQVWIIRSDINPVEAIVTGNDCSICGNCPHRGDETHKRTCYVNVPKAVLSIYRAYKRGSYQKWDGSLDLFENADIRWGAYGDPSLISPEIVQRINSVAKMWTGYTHQWKNPFAAQFKSFFQASCDSLDDKSTAQSAGWGTFTVTPQGYDIKNLGKVTVCPASLSDKVKCIDCGKCNGAFEYARQVVIPAHGKAAGDVQWAAD